jgi:hypothetical protein
LTSLLAEYGRVALYTYLSLFVLVFAGFAAAIFAGVQVEGSAGNAGVVGAAYVATKVTQPLRILGTLALTPLVAALLKRLGLTQGAARADAQGGAPDTNK